MTLAIGAECTNDELLHPNLTLNPKRPLATNVRKGGFNYFGQNLVVVGSFKIKVFHESKRGYYTSLISAEYDDYFGDENFAPKKKVRYEEQTVLETEVLESPQPPRIAMMRHEIAHRFKSVWMVLKQVGIYHRKSTNFLNF